MGEFELIRRYFHRPDGAPASQAAGPGGRVALGVGDDCALLAPAPGMQLAVSSDMLVEGRHFLSTVDPARLGHKALAVNLSDLAACGAKPLAFTLALALPALDEAWLAGFSRGLFALADAHGCALAGGDTTRGPLNICITVFGEVPAGGALLRSGARAGDDMEQPTPRVALGQALRGIASAAIDISDGLIGDLGHLLAGSRVGATVDADVAINLIAACAQPSCPAGLFDLEARRGFALSGGDDYELAFSAPASARAAVEQAGHASATPVTRIGRIDAEAGLRVVDAQGQAITQRFAGFDHFG